MQDLRKYLIVGTQDLENDLLLAAIMVVGGLALLDFVLLVYLLGCAALGYLPPELGGQ